MSRWKLIGPLFWEGLAEIWWLTQRWVKRHTVCRLLDHKIIFGDIPPPLGRLPDHAYYTVLHPMVAHDLLVDYCARCEEEFENERSEPFLHRSTVSYEELLQLIPLLRKGAKEFKYEQTQ